MIQSHTSYIFREKQVYILSKGRTKSGKIAVIYTEIVKKENDSKLPNILLEEEFELEATLIE